MMTPRLYPRAPAPGVLPATPVVFSPQSEAMLGGVDPRLAELMRRVEAAHPDAFEITEARRTKERQADMVAQGKSQTMNSKHITGNAVDIALIGPDGKPNWDFEAYRPIADTAKAVAAELGIPDFVWGGDWKTLKDGVHFQVGGPGTAQTPVAAAPTGSGTLPPVSAPVVTPPAVQISPEEARKKRLSLLADLGMDLMPQPTQAPQLLPVQRAPYAPERRDDMASILRFFQSIG